MIKAHVINARIISGSNKNASLDCKKKASILKILAINVNSKKSKNQQ
jgi:hypothetical protein